MEIGIIKKGTEIGKKDNHKYIWHACIDCGKLRWVQLQALKHNNNSGRCMSCSGKKTIPHKFGKDASNWKGGRTQLKSGYILVSVSPDDFFYPMVSKGGQVLEHRLVMAKHLQRCLLPWEIVHHKNSVKNDNHLENLKLFTTQTFHSADIQLKRRTKLLEKRVTLLEAENERLKLQLEGIFNEITYKELA